MLCLSVLLDPEYLITYFIHGFPTKVGLVFPVFYFYHVKLLQMEQLLNSCVAHHLLTWLLFSFVIDYWLLNVLQFLLKICVLLCILRNVHVHSLKRLILYDIFFRFWKTRFEVHPERLVQLRLFILLETGKRSE